MTEEVETNGPNYNMENLEGSNLQFDTSNANNGLNYDNSSNKFQVAPVTHNDQAITTISTVPSTPIVNGLLCHYNAQTGIGNNDLYHYNNHTGHGNNNFTLNSRLQPTELDWNGVKIQEIHNDHNAPGASSTSKEDKQSWFIESFSVQLSKLYAVLLVMLGLTFYVGDSFRGTSFVLAEAFNIFLMVVQFLFLLYIQFDVRMFLNAQKENPKLYDTNSSDQRYGFSSSRHGGSLYLKIGATCFAFGYLMYIGLETGKIIIHNSVDTCYTTTELTMSIFHIIHVFYQLFFLFKYSNLIINHHVFASRFGLMHCIATSICFWLFMIYEEILYSLTFHAAAPHEPVHPIEPIHPEEHYAPKAGVTWELQANSCNATDSALEGTINTLSPFLYPICVEFNLLQVGLWILIWQNLGRIEKHEKLPSIQTVNEDNSKTNFQSNLIISVDCHSSNRGIFIGLLGAIFTIISVIILFVYTYTEPETEEDKLKYETGMFLRSVTELTLLLALTVTVVIAYRSIQQLDLITHFLSSVDRILLFISQPFIFLFAFLNIIANVQNTEPGESVAYHVIIVMCLYIVQPVIQTLFICDALHRCSNTVELQHKKPGREVVTFLVISNVTMWLLESLQMNTFGANEDGVNFYGETMWRVLVHITMPLSLFYRFHSSACIADIWKDAYEAE